MRFSTCFAVAISAAAACDPGPSSGTDARVLDYPVGFTFESVEGGFASFGWSGQLHHVTGAPGTPFGVTRTQCDDTGVCRFAGPSEPASSVKRRRCLFRTSQLCETDEDCGPAKHDGNNYAPCVYLYDAPVSTPLAGGDGKIGACSFSFIPLTAPDGTPSITGTLNLTTAALNIENLTVLLPLNARPGTGGAPAGFAGVCAECVGDTAPNDGRTDGICQVSTHTTDGHADPGLDIGRPCDAHRYGTIPGYDGSYSMDCSPTLTRGLGSPTQFGGSFTSSGYQLDVTAQSPKCTVAGFEDEHCLCGMCADGVTACMSSADCGGQPCGMPSIDACDPNPYPGEPGHDPALAVHQCKLAPDATKFGVGGHACVGECKWDATRSTGTCNSKLTGQPIGCYPHGIGKRIRVEGRALRKTNESTIYYADTATARCIAAGRVPALNSQLGLPGLMLQKRNFSIIPTYAGERP
jgi:hypothetical protein